MCSAARSSSPRPTAIFPSGTIFLVVVDPGVGSTRRGIAAESGDYRFVAPDNGVLTAVLDEHPAKRIVELTERKYARPTVSRTFEGRDRFAPAAAWLAKGIDLAALGRSAGAVQRLDIPRAALADGRIDGQVLRVDRFGNLITQHRSPDVREARRRPARHPDRHAPGVAGGLDLRRRVARRSVRAVRQHRPSGDRGQRRERRRGARSRARRAGARRPPRVIRFRGLP